MTCLGLAVAAALAAAEVRLQPATARPGDPVLVHVTGSSRPPAGRLGADELTFLPYRQGHLALIGLPVERATGPLPAELTLADEGGPRAVRGSVTVGPAGFRRRRLTVSSRFTRISKKDRQRSADDSRAFAEAFDRDFEPWRFTEGFAWPIASEVTAPFGDVRLLNGRKKSQHFGLDLDGEVGDPVAASNDGEVVLVRDCFASGNTVLVHHGGRLFTAYFHLSAVDVTQGQVVRRGQRLGRVGKTGRVTGPHLHWGVKLDGRWINGAALVALDLGGPPTPAADAGR